MFGSSILETIIGVSFTFLVASLVCTSVLEGIEGVLKTRAKDLERGIREILDDPDGKGVTATFFAHPLIAALFPGKYNPNDLEKGSWLTGKKDQLHMPVSARRSLPSYIPGTSFAQALVDIVTRSGSTAPPAGQPSAATLRAAALTIQNVAVQRAVISALDVAGNDLDAVRTNLAAWYDSAMDRVSGWYKRRTQLILFVLGLFTAVVLNLDAITVSRTIADNGTLRAALADMADSTVAVGTAPGEKPKPLDLAAVQKQLLDIGFPMGWRGSLPVPQFCKASPPVPDCKVKFDALIGARTLVGWLVTAFAIMLGAPFWFDVLAKFVSIRSSGKPPAKEKEAPAEEPKKK